MQQAQSNLDQEALLFMQALANELAAGKVELPSYPEAAMRVQRALSADEVDLDLVIRAISAEPLLAVRVLQMANAAMFNSMGRQVSDLRTAVMRLGYNVVRTAAMAFIVQQLLNKTEFGALQPKLAALWKRSIALAALSRVVARRRSRLNTDVALLTGLLHGIGRLCIFVRLAAQPALQTQPEVCARILEEWQTDIAAALLTDWGMSEDLVDAVRFYADEQRIPAAGVDLTDVLAAAARLGTLREQLAEAVPSVETVLPLIEADPRFWQRLDIDAGGVLLLLAEAEESIDQLNALLGG
jgi:HD-like signal output (HDOD) protein